jgi:signal transduction histidine kinase
LKQKSGSKQQFVILIAANILCILLIVALFINNATVFRKKLYNQNINNIGNLNRSSGTVAQSVFIYQSQKISDISRYIESNDMDLDTAISFIQFMSNDTLGDFEIISSDHTGYLVSHTGSSEITYEDKSYSALHQLFDAAAEKSVGNVSYTPEFTDACTAFKCFAFYTYVGITGPAEKEYYTLMYVSRSDEMMEKIQQTGSYSQLSVTLMDDSGNYIIGNPNFKSENFFKYLYVFNDLTLDEMNAVSAKVLSTDSGTLNYKNSEGANCVFIYSRPLGETWYSVSCVPIDSFDYSVQGNNLTVFVTLIFSAMMIMNILWLNSMNHRLKKSVEREIKANAAKTEFLSRMSHDIRTPLNAILGFAAITRDSPSLDPSLKDNLEKIDTSGQYLLGIINDVLDMSKIESGKVELYTQSTDCEKIFTDVLQIFTGEAKQKGIKLEHDFKLGISRYLILDPLRTKQIFSNLLSNAIKFSDSGTLVRWTIEESAMEDGNIKVISMVTDQGCGMTPEFLNNLFDPFSQEQNIHSGEMPGTGLGLSIVNRLIRLMNGNISVKSEQGLGTEFTVTLIFPRGTNEGAGYSDHSKTAMPKDVLKGKHVLLCEDNALNREIASTLLTSWGVSSESAENGKTGLDIFSSSEEGYFDAILMDIRMPVMNGLEATMAIRSLNRSDSGSIPIIAMTANAYSEDIRECLAAGMNAHLPKPFDPDELFNVLASSITLRDSRRSDNIK